MLSTTLATARAHAVAGVVLRFAVAQLDRFVRRRWRPRWGRWRDPACHRRAARRLRRSAGRANPGFRVRRRARSVATLMQAAPACVRSRTSWRVRGSSSKIASASRRTRCRSASVVRYSAGDLPSTRAASRHPSIPTVSRSSSAGCTGRAAAPYAVQKICARSRKSLVRSGNVHAFKWRCVRQNARSNVGSPQWHTSWSSRIIADGRSGSTSRFLGL